MCAVIEQKQLHSVKYMYVMVKSVLADAVHWLPQMCGSNKRKMQYNDGVSYVDRWCV